MLPASNPDLHPLIRKLESIAPVSDDARRAIAALPITVRDLKADADIVRDQDRPSQCCAILEGFACRYKPAQRRCSLDSRARRTGRARERSPRPVGIALIAYRRSDSTLR